MKRTSWEILPRKEYRTSTSQIPLMLRVRINGKYFKLMLGITISALKDWDSKNIQIRNNQSIQVREANRIIAKYSSRVTKILADAQIEGKTLDRSEFKRLLFEDTVTSTTSFYDFCLEEVTEMKKTGFAKETIRSYGSYITKLNKYRQNLLFREINHDFIRGLNAYMVSIENNENTRQKMFAFLNTMLNRAVKRKLIKENLLHRNNPVNKIDGQRSFLTIDELRKLELFKPESRQLQTVLEYFLFACYTGLRYTDLKDLRFSDIDSILGEPHIRIIMHKTKGEVTIPLIPKALALIPTKGFPNQRVFKVKCNQVSNRELKTIMKKVGINKTISMHCARHTFATVALTLGVDIVVISNVLGHRDLGTTRIYAKLLDERKIEEIKKWEKLNIR